MNIKDIKEIAALTKSRVPKKYRMDDALHESFRTDLESEDVDAVIENAYLYGVAVGIMAAREYLDQAEGILRSVKDLGTESILN